MGMGGAIPQVRPSAPNQPVVNTNGIERRLDQLLNVQKSQKELLQRLLSVMTANKIGEQLGGGLGGPIRNENRRQRLNKRDGMGSSGPRGPKKGGISGIPPIGLVSAPVLTAPPVAQQQLADDAAKKPIQDDGTQGSVGKPETQPGSSVDADPAI